MLRIVVLAVAASMPALPPVWKPLPIELSATTSEEQAMRGKINGARQAQARAALSAQSRLATIARRHAKRMADRGQIYHNPRLAQEAAGLPWRILGENVGVGSAVPELHTAFMNSPPHRRNVLTRAFRRVGVGIVPSNDRLWVVVVFLG